MLEISETGNKRVTHEEVGNPLMPQIKVDGSYDSTAIQGHHVIHFSPVTNFGKRIRCLYLLKTLIFQSC